MTMRSICKINRHLQLDTQVLQIYEDGGVITLIEHEAQANALVRPSGIADLAGNSLAPVLSQDLHDTAAGQSHPLLHQDSQACFARVHQQPRHPSPRLAAQASQQQLDREWLW